VEDWRGFSSIPIERRNHMALYPITRAAGRNLKREVKVDVVTKKSLTQDFGFRFFPLP
jgi:hypothetical protein